MFKSDFLFPATGYLGFWMPYGWAELVIETIWSDLMMILTAVLLMFQVSESVEHWLDLDVRSLLLLRP